MPTQGTPRFQDEGSAPKRLPRSDSLRISVSSKILGKTAFFNGSSMATQRTSTSPIPRFLVNSAIEKSFLKARTSEERKETARLRAAIFGQSVAMVLGGSRKFPLRITQ